MAGEGGGRIFGDAGDLHHLKTTSDETSRSWSWRFSADEVTSSSFRASLLLLYFSRVSLVVSLKKTKFVWCIPAITGGAVWCTYVCYNL